MSGIDLEMMKEMWPYPSGSKNFSNLAQQRIDFVSSRLINSSYESLYNLSEFFRCRPMPLSRIGVNVIASTYQGTLTVDYIEPSPNELDSVMLHFKINIANNVDPAAVPSTLLEELLASEGIFDCDIYILTTL